MGSHFGIVEKSSTMDEISPIIPYICESVRRELTVDPKVSLVLKPSRLPSTFVEGINMGLFTENFIPKGTTIIVLDSNPGMGDKMNDAAIDLKSILEADTSEKTYQAWMDAKNSYYNLEKIKQVVNVRMVANNNVTGYETIRDIPADGELTRVYGFTTWILELFEILTNKNIVGFAQFIDYLFKNITNDPYEDRIKILHLALSQYGIKDIFTIDRNGYDESMRDESVFRVGSKLSMLYVINK